MRYIPAKVVFDDQEKELLKGYMSEWDETGEKRAAIDASAEFDICTVREGDQNVRGFRIEYGRQDRRYADGSSPPYTPQVSYVSFQGFEQYMLNQGWVNGKQYQMGFTAKKHEVAT